MQNLPDYLADYATLRAPVGCDLEQLKRCYRRAVRELHPDLNHDLADAPGAQHALQQLTSAHRRLCDFHRQHGRLPGTAPATAEWPEATTADEAPAAPEQPAAPHRRGVALLALVAGAVAAWLAWAPQPASRDGVSAESTQIHAEEDVIPVREPSPAVERGIRVGDDKRRVLAILGPPIVRSARIWQYGPSHVTFDHGLVSGWHNSPLRPIRVDAGVIDPRD